MEIKSNLFTFPGVNNANRKVTNSTYNEGLVEYREKTDEFLDSVGMTVDRAAKLKYGFAIDIYTRGKGSPIQYRKEVTGFDSLLDEITEFYKKFDALGQVVLYKNYTINRRMFIHADIAVYGLNEYMDENLLNDRIDDLVMLADMKSTLAFCHVMSMDEEVEMRREYTKNAERAFRLKRREMHPYDDLRFSTEAATGMRVVTDKESAGEDCEV